MPKVFHTQSSSEYWHRSGSLVHTDPVLSPGCQISTFSGIVSRTTTPVATWSEVLVTVSVKRTTVLPNA